MKRFGWTAALPLLIALLGARRLDATVRLPFDIMRGPPPATAEPNVFIFGGHLMTPDERAGYRQELRSLPSNAERAAFRGQHKQKMIERAKQYDAEVWRRYEK